MNILLTNDDGIHADGLCVLKEALDEQHTVTVVAPDGERSAAAHAITLHLPLILDRIEKDGRLFGYSISGTPADCVKLAVQELLPDRPDIVISGINPGPNVGINLHYSGTVSAAKEAALLGISAIAVSINSPDGHLETAARFTRDLANFVRKEGLPHGIFLNVNIPDLEQIGGVRITKQGISGIEEAFYRRTDPKNRTYFWQGSQTRFTDHDKETDGHSLSENLVSITPIRCDMTDHDEIKRLKHLERIFSQRKS
ncbi:MAG: 5'/3'-nucleotidase SurE [Desulfobacterales bacterium]|nr:5'/3'-nucleotidase SurE [Desulfobacterales bacterium]